MEEKVKPAPEESTFVLPVPTDAEWGEMERRARFALLLREFDNAEIREKELEFVAGACLRGESVQPENVMRVLGFASRLASMLREARVGLRRKEKNARGAEYVPRGGTLDEAIRGLLVQVEAAERLARLVLGKVCTDYDSDGDDPYGCTVEILDGVTREMVSAAREVLVGKP